VLIEGSPDVYTPQNVAVAVNENCSYCDTLATAYQFVFQGSGRLELTREGRKQLKDVLAEIRDLRKSGLTGPEIQAQVDAAADRIFQIFSTELRTVKDDDRRDQTGAEGDGFDGNQDLPTTTTQAPTTTPTGSRAATTTTQKNATTTTGAPTTTTSTTTSSTSTTTTTAP
jgi:hypothetical protein